MALKLLAKLLPLGLALATRRRRQDLGVEDGASAGGTPRPEQDVEPALPPQASLPARKNIKKGDRKKPEQATTDPSQIARLQDGKIERKQQQNLCERTNRSA